MSKLKTLQYLKPTFIFCGILFLGWCADFVAISFSGSFSAHFGTDFILDAPSDTSCALDLGVLACGT